MQPILFLILLSKHCSVEKALQAIDHNLLTHSPHANLKLYHLLLNIEHTTEHSGQCLSIYHIKERVNTDVDTSHIF